MNMRIKALLGVAAAALLASGCATGPYYSDYGYSYGYGYEPYPYGYGPAYYGPAYLGPSVGLGYTYYDHDRRHWHDHDDRRRWRGDREDRRDTQPSIAPTPDTYRGPRNHAGEAIGPGYRGPPGSDSPG